MLLLLVEVDTHVEAMVASQAEVVALQGIDAGNRAPFVNQAIINLCAKGAAVATAKDPCTTDVESVAELVLHGNTDVVATVVFSRKHLAVVDFHAFAVELTFGVGPSVANPACCLAEAALHEKFYTIRPTFAEADLVIPGFGRTEKRSAILVFQKVVHLFVVAFDGNVEQVSQLIESAERHLMRFHRLDLCRDRHPKVRWQAKAAIGEQVDILRHISIARLEREVGGQHHAGAQARLHALVGLAFDGESGIMHTCVVLSVKRRLMSEDIRRTHYGVDLDLVSIHNLRRLHFWPEHVIGVIATKADFMVRQGGVVEVDFGGQVVDA